MGTELTNAPAITLPRWRSTVRLLLAGVAVVGLVALTYYLVFYPFAVHHRWYRAFEYRILSLAERRPNDVDSKQWAACLHWTWNLHANCGAATYFDPRARDLLLEEFDRRLQKEVSLSTIDWIWDQYVLHSRGGRRYSDHYRPTTAERLNEASLDRYGEYKLDGWLELLRQRRQSGD
jgi:hypothetical protein